MNAANDSTRAGLEPATASSPGAGVPERKSAAAQSKYIQKRDLVLSAALDLFLTNGYDATSLQQIADKSGLLKGSLYYYFRSKKDLLLRLVEEIHERFSGTLREFDTQRDPLVQIAELLRSAAVDAAKNQRLLRVFYREFQRLTEEERRYIVELRDDQDKLLTRLVVEGQDRGEISPDLDPQITAIGLGSYVNSIYAWYQPGGRLSAEEIADQLVHGCERPEDLPHRVTGAARSTWPMCRSTPPARCFEW